MKELKDKLSAHNVSIRGNGLMIGIGLESEAGGIITDLRENGLLTLPAGPKVIRLLPPLTVSREEIDQAVAKVEEALGKATAVV